MAKKSLARKIMLSIFAGAVLFSNSIAWAESLEDTFIKVNECESYEDTSDTINGTHENSATATGLGAIAIGSGAIASQTGENTNINSDSIAVGHSAQARNSYSVAIGGASRTEGDFAVAIGETAQASHMDAVALGRSAMGFADYAVAIGSIAQAQSSDSVALGHAAAAYHENSVALGANSYTSEENQVSIEAWTNIQTEPGTNNIIDKVVTYRSLVGLADVEYYDDTEEYGHYAVNVNTLNKALSTKLENNSTSDDALAIGNDASAAGNGVVAIGAYSGGMDENSTQEYDISIGYYAGNGPITTQDFFKASLAIGAYTTANEGGIAVGSNATANSTGSIAIGSQYDVINYYYAEKYGDISISKTNAQSFNGVAIGSGAQTVGGSNTVVIGAGAFAYNHDNSVALGANSEVTASNQVSIGGAIFDKDTGARVNSFTRTLVGVSDVENYSDKSEEDGTYIYGNYAVNVNTLNSALENVQTVTGLNGLSTDAVTDAYTDTNYIKEATSLIDADKALDTELKKVSDSVSGLAGVGGAVTNLQASVTELNSTVEGHTSSINALNTAVGNHTESITNLSSTISSHTESITAINNSIRNIGDLSGLTEGIDKDSIIKAINSVYEEAKKHTTVSAGNGVTVTGTTSGGSTETTDTNDTTSTATGTGGTDYKVSANIKGDDTNINVTLDEEDNSHKVSLNENITVNSVTSNEVTVKGENGSTVIDGDNITFYDKNNNAGTTITNNSVTTSIINATTANITEEIVVGTGDNQTTIEGNTVTATNVNTTNVTSNNVTSSNVTVHNKFEFVDGENVTTTIDKDGMTTNNATVNNTFIVGDTNNEYTKIDGDTVTITNQDGSTTIEGDTINSTTIKLGDNVTVNNEGMTIKGDTTNVIINKDGITFGGDDNTANGPSINNNGMDMNNTTISNVKDGEVSATSKDAVNGSQLYQEATERMIADQKLNSRLNKVGAGAAALAALHPLDFDPDDKLSFSAGVGNYAGENAAALGMFYRPNEKVMLSMGGTMGNGENMVNMGITFALDKPNNVSNSRVAMAKEIVAMREHIAKQDAQIAQLVMLVNQLTGNVAQQEATPAFSPSGRVRVERLTDGYEEYDRVKIEKGAELDGDNSKTVEAK